MATLTTLKDGSQVPSNLVQPILWDLGAAQKENSATLWELVTKCQNASHVISPYIRDLSPASPPGGLGLGPLEIHPLDPATILKKHGLLDDSGNVPENVRKIVLNSVDLTRMDNILNWLSIESPLASSAKVQPHSNRWNWCVIL